MRVMRWCIASLLRCEERLDRRESADRRDRARLCLEDGRDESGVSSPSSSSSSSSVWSLS